MYTTAAFDEDQSHFGCKAAYTLDKYYCPSSRKVALTAANGGPPDVVGVWIKMHHAYYTKFIADSVTLTDQSGHRGRTEAAVRRRLSMRRAERRDGEAGLALIETAIVAPFLILLVLGIWEFSNGWQSNLTVQTSVRAGARTGSGLGNDRAADYAVLQAVKAGMTDFSTSDIQTVVVYKASAAERRPAAGLPHRHVLVLALVQRVHGHGAQHVDPGGVHRYRGDRVHGHLPGPLLVSHHQERVAGEPRVHRRLHPCPVPLPDRVLPRQRHHCGEEHGHADRTQGRGVTTERARSPGPPPGRRRPTVRSASRATR